MTVFVNITDNFRLEIMSYCTVIFQKKTQTGAKKINPFAQIKKKEN